MYGASWVRNCNFWTWTTQESCAAAAGFAPMMPPLERPAPLVDEQGNDLDPGTAGGSSSASGDQGKDTKRSAANG